jgi:phosphonate transport system permease protein
VSPRAGRLKESLGALARAWLSPRSRVPKSPLIALATDWALLLYFSYCVFFLINYWYRAIAPVSPVYQVPFPTYGYVLTVGATFLLALVWGNLGTSVGGKALGVVLLDARERRASLGLRLRHLLADLASWLATLAAAGLLVAPGALLGSLAYGLAHGHGISLVPGVSGPPWGGWPLSVGSGILAALLVLAAACLSWLAANAVLGALWPIRKGRTPWRDRVVGSRAARAADLEAAGPGRHWWQSSWGLFILLLVLLTVYVGSLATQISLKTLVTRASSTGYMWKWLVNPDFRYFAAPDPVLGSSIGAALVETIFMALIATAFGVILAFPLSFLGARNIMARSPAGWFVYTLTRGVFNVIRSIETVVWALVLGLWVGFGSFAGVLALTWHTIAALGKLYSEQVEAIDPGPLEAIAASGARRWQVVRYGVIPQIIPPFVAFTLYRWDINVRMATVVGLVGGGGIGRMLFYYKNEFQWQDMGAVIAGIVAVVWLMDYVSGRVRERIT